MISKSTTQWSKRTDMILIFHKNRKLWCLTHSKDVKRHFSSIFFNFNVLLIESLLKAFLWRNFLSFYYFEVADKIINEFSVLVDFWETLLRLPFSVLMLSDKIYFVIRASQRTISDISYFILIFQRIKSSPIFTSSDDHL